MLHDKSDLNKEKEKFTTRGNKWNTKFPGCDATSLKSDIYAVTNIGVEISVHIQVIIPVKASYFWKGIQHSTIQQSSKWWKIEKRTLIQIWKAPYMCVFI